MARVAPERLAEIRIANAMRRDGYKSLEEMAQQSDAVLLSIPGFGVTTLQRFRKLMGQEYSRPKPVPRPMFLPREKL